MLETTTDRNAPEATLEAVINYHDRREAREGGKAILDLETPSNTTFLLDPQPVRVHDARRAVPEATIERNGFALVRHASAVTDFYDPEQIRRIYYPEVEGLIRRLTGAEEVLVFGEILRSDDAGRLARGRTVAEGHDPTRGPPAGGAHVDFDETAVRAYVEDIAGPEEARRLLAQRFMLINLWRPIAPVLRMPLAVCDASTVTEADFIPVGIRAPVGPKPVKPKEGYNVAFSPRHRWYYYPRMQPGEALLFKLFDSEPSSVQFTAHSAFADPTSPPDAPPRESFEIRTIGFFPTRTTA